MKRIICVLPLLLLLAGPLRASENDQVERLQNSAVVLSEIMNIPEDSVPRDLLNKAECISVIPSMKKAALGIGGNYGKGCLVCRTATGWTSPVMVQITGGSVGFQLGFSSTDLILLVMNKRGINKLLESQLTLGADATVAGGPKGRETAAMTDAQMRAEILSYARSRGLFAGVSLDGYVLRPDKDDNIALYGVKVDPKAILAQTGTIPESAQSLINLLNKYSPGSSATDQPGGVH